jgi:DNA polymerase-4
VVEAASIDEAYLDMAGTGPLHGDSLVATARRIQDAVLSDAGIVVSIGGGTNRMIAKLAAGAAKPAGVHVVPPGGEAAFMRTLSISDIPGVGPVFAARLQRLGMIRVEDALAVDEATLSQVLDPGRGTWLFRRIRGLDDSVVGVRGAAKSMSRDETFAEDLSSDDDLARELLALTVRLGGDLRDAGYRARTVTVRIRDADFTNRSASRTLDEALESDRALFSVARELLNELRKRRRVRARLLSVSVSHLTNSAGGLQLTLFVEGNEAEALETSRDRQLSRAVDQLRARFGKGPVLPGRLVE